MSSVVKGDRSSEKRWNWINGWLTACLHACICGVGLRVDKNLVIGALIKKYAQQVRKDLASLSSTKIAIASVENGEIDYVFHLEEEIWGPDWQQYTKFFPQSSEQSILLQSFHFVLCFYIVERVLKMFADKKKRYSLSRKRLRRIIFGQKDGLFTVYLPNAMAAMGPPFFLAANTRRVETVGITQTKWNSLCTLSQPRKLKSFYQATTNKEHFCKVIESALVSTRNDHVVKSLRKAKGKKLPKGTQSYWYDVLWHYSESIRYHPLTLAPQSVTDPFHWNRTVRWFTSIAITGLLLIAQKMGAPVPSVWGTRRQSRLWQALGGSARFSDGL